MMNKAEKALQPSAMPMADYVYDFAIRGRGRGECYTADLVL